MIELPWLRPAPEYFNRLCSKLQKGEVAGESLAHLAGFSQTLNQANRLYHVVRNMDPTRVEDLACGYSAFKLGITSNGTLDLLLPSLFIACLRRGIWLETVMTGFDQTLQEALDPDSLLNTTDVDLVLLALDYRTYGFAAGTVAASSRGFDAEDAIAHLRQIKSGLFHHSGKHIIAQTLAPPPLTLAGNLDRKLCSTLRHETYRFNDLVTAETGGAGDYLLDVAALAEAVGTNHWYDERLWLRSRIPMSFSAGVQYCERLASLLAAIRGKSKKCLVLDLDNTVWGGIIGDDGIEGIQLGQGNPMGEAYLSLQKYARELKEHGVILAVCSKNDDAIAKIPFQNHPDMLLNLDDIAVFVANWEDKPSNIRRIASALNIGLDSLVLVDDNPAEREIVRQLLPQVAVPELPTDPAMYVRILAAANYFETLSITAEDRDRADQYQQNWERIELLNKSQDMDEYLRSLQMVATISKFDDVGRSRIVQLVNKTNQFNLTTKRYTESEICDFEASGSVHALQIRLRDRFGDNGMVSVVICKEYGSEWHIDTWLMSCRVINRRLEELVCDELVRLASARDVDSFLGYYRQTEKNRLVKEHYQSLGFSRIGGNDSEDVWALDVRQYVPRRPPIQCERK